jgi:Putative peptidoglycan binding domain
MSAPNARPHHYRRLLIIALVIAAAAAVAVVLLVADPFAGGQQPAGTQDNSYPTSQATVVRRTLSSQDQVAGTLGYAGSYQVLGQLPGTLTTLPRVGQVIHSGQVIYRASDAPVILLDGHVPAYRALSEGLSGPDVKELNANLVNLGYATKAALDPSSTYFGSATFYALEKLQQHLGVTETGALALGDAVFLPGPVRITALAGTLGGAATGPLATASSTRRQVTVALDAAQQSLVKVGDKVTISLPDNSTTPGLVSSVGKVATVPSDNSAGAGSAAATVTVHIAPSHPAATGQLDQAPVEVAITTATVKHALVVPVSALLALAGGGYAVEVVSAGGAHHLVAVTPGLFDDAQGLVEVTGAGLAAAEHVVVPGS